MRAWIRARCTDRTSRSLNADQPVVNFDSATIFILSLQPGAMTGLTMPQTISWWNRAQRIDALLHRRPDRQAAALIT